MNKVLYLFCLTTASAMPVMDVELLPGFSPLFMYPFQGFNAILSWVPAKEYQDLSTDNHLMNTEALMQRVFFHELIVEKIMHSAAVFPMSFVTLFSSTASLEESISKHQTFISSCLENINQKDEYAIRVFMKQDQAVESLVSAQMKENESSWASYSPGVKYLKKQQLHKEVQSHLNQYLDRWLDEVLDLFHLHSSHFKNRENSPQSSDTHGTSILHWAFLIPQAMSSLFREQVDFMNVKYNSSGLHFALTGPWPAYSFCTLQSIEVPQ